MKKIIFFSLILAGLSFHAKAEENDSIKELFDLNDKCNPENTSDSKISKDELICQTEKELGRVLTSQEKSGVEQAFEIMDKNKDEALSYEEFTSAHEATSN